MNRPFFSRQVFRARIFQRHAATGTRRGLAVVYGGCEHCADDYRIHRTRFPFWCLEFVVSGRGKVAVAKQRPRSLEPGAIFVYGPDTEYWMESDSERPFVKYFADFTGKRAPALLREVGLRAGTLSHVFPPGPVADTFDRLIDAGLDSAPHAPRRTALLLEELLLSCADSRVPDGAAESRAFATYRRCRDLIDGLDPRAAAIRSVAATSRACHIDSAYLCRLFQRFARTSPYHYLTRRRIEAATVRLAQNRGLIKEVADEFGFADPYHFSRAFKRFHGIAPALFLRRRK